MLSRIRPIFYGLSLTRRYIIASLVVIILGTLGIGWWVNMQITNGVIHRTSASAALYVNNFIAHDLQDLATTGTVLPAHLQELDQLVKSSPLGQQIVAFKVWNTAGVVQYSTDQTIIGKTFPIEGGLAQALNGEVSSTISNLSKAENVAEQAYARRLIETYIPVRLSGTERVIAVVEFYQKVDDLQKEIAAAQMRSWLVVGGAMAVIFILLSGFVKRASDTIDQQKVKLSGQVSRLTELLGQNEVLHERVRRAAARVTTLHEQLLRRVGSELHDGPAQDVSLALLKLDTLISQAEKAEAHTPADTARAGQLEEVQSTLQTALQELRLVASGLALPELAGLTIAETARKAVQAHERRTRSRVELNLSLPATGVPLPVKITLYRLIQESLNNAWHHAGGKGQAVSVMMADGQVMVEICDQGNGFDASQASGQDQHLGIAGMRERVESLGGQFAIESQPGQGTKVRAQFSAQDEGGRHG